MSECTTVIGMLCLTLHCEHDVVTGTKLNRTRQSLHHSYKNTVCQTHDRCLTDSLHGTSE